MDLNLDHLLEMIWEYLALVRIFTKRRGAYPDFDDAIVMNQGTTVESVCKLIHK
jgi:ribosome-interacting GTPase 1